MFCETDVQYHAKVHELLNNLHFLTEKNEN